MENNINLIDNKENVVKNNDDKAIKKTDKELTLTRKVSFIRESVSDSGVPERKLSATLEAAKRNSLRSQEAETDVSSVDQASGSPKVPKKFISTWRQACDRTKDRTKELLKRWKTLPEGNTEMIPPSVNTTNTTSSSGPENPHNWSVHVWASYIKRYPSEEDNLLEDNEACSATITLSSSQKEKLGHFFSHLLDNDQDDLISEQDFDNFSERLRRFADWSINSPEFVIMLQVQHGFLETFMVDKQSKSEGDAPSWKQFISLEDWFLCWSKLTKEARNLTDFPLWLHYLPKLLFQAINKSGSGTISRDELGSFYSSMLGFTTQRVGEILDEAFNALTSNGDHTINFYVYRLAFTNFLLGRHPNGPGQYLFGCVSKKSSCFMIDYSALNTQPEDLEHYTPKKKSNRYSVVV